MYRLVDQEGYDETGVDAPDKTGPSSRHRLLLSRHTRWIPSGLSARYGGHRLPCPVSRELHYGVGLTDMTYHSPWMPETRILRVVIWPCACSLQLYHATPATGYQPHRHAYQSPPLPSGSIRKERLPQAEGLARLTNRRYYRLARLPRHLGDSLFLIDEGEADVTL